MNINDIPALLRLLEDSNPEIAHEAARLLVLFGAEALPALQEFADHNPTLATRLTARIEAQLLEKEWIALARQPDAEKAALLVARWLDPLSDPEHLKRQLDALAAPLEGAIPSEANRMGYRRDALALRDWLANTKRFRGNRADYYAPHNSLLPYVLERRLGIPLSLSMIYLFVARRLGAPLHPIAMPSHFIVRYGTAADGIFIDPYNQGSLMTANDCRRWFIRHGGLWRNSYLNPVSDYLVVSRMLHNLAYAYEQRGNPAAHAQTIEYLQIWTRHPPRQSSRF